MSDVNRDKLLKRLQQLDFVLLETNLFLDSHPTNRKALAYFNKMNKERQIVYDQYVKAYGPMTIFDSEDSEIWTWAESIWPWEMED